MKNTGFFQEEGRGLKKEDSLVLQQEGRERKRAWGGPLFYGIGFCCDPFHRSPDGNRDGCFVGVGPAVSV